MKGKAVFIGDFLHRIKRPVNLEQGKKYKLVTVKLKHNGVVLREEKSGAEIKSKMFEVKAGDFILSGIDARNGAFGIIPPELDGAIVTNDFWYFKIDEQIVDKHFFLELTSTQWFDEICRKGSDGTTQRIRLQKNKFFNQRIFLPNLQEQRTFISQFQQIKENNNVLKQEFSIQQTLLKKLRQQILQEAVEGKLTTDWRAQHPDVEPASELLARIQAEKAQLVKAKKISKQNPLPPISEEEKPFALPDGWAWCRLGDFAEIKIGATPERSNPAYWGGDIHWVSSGEVANNYISSSREKITSKAVKESSAKINPKGSVLVAMIGQGKTRGQTAILDINAAIRLPKHIISELVWYFFLSRYEITRSSATGGNQPALNGIKIKNTVFSLPSVLESKEIVAKVEKLLSLCDQLEHEISQNQCRAEQLMQAVLSEAFSQPSEQTTQPAAVPVKRVMKQGELFSRQLVDQAQFFPLLLQAEQQGFYTEAPSFPCSSL